MATVLVILLAIYVVGTVCMTHVIYRHARSQLKRVFFIYKIKLLGWSILYASIWPYDITRALFTGTNEE